MATENTKATPFNIQLSAQGTPGRYNVAGSTQDSADRASELLMVNHVRYHTLFDEIGFHNHTVHHLLTLYALGATKEEIQVMYDLNKPYQALIQRKPASVIVGLQHREFFKQCIGKPAYYGDFLRFFQDEISQKGVPSVVNEYVFKGDELADDIFSRMHSGFLHPLIHLGCALEFHQPCLVAESLAAACIHDEWPQLFLLPTQEHSRKNEQKNPKTLLEVLKDLRQDAEISSAVTPSDPINKISDGLLSRVSTQIVPYLSQFQVQPRTDEIQSRLTEMMHTCAYMVGAAQHPGKVEALDFVMMHTVTLSVFYPTFMEQDWISNYNKKRLLEWKAWSDAVMYAGCGCPPLYRERLTEYAPKRPRDGWPELAHRANVYRDDGHACKLIRALFALYHGEEPSRQFPLARNDFLTMAHMALDSVERMLEPGKQKVPDRITKAVAEEMGQDDEIVRVMVRWVRWCGLEGAWDDFPDLPKATTQGTA